MSCSEVVSSWVHDTGPPAAGASEGSAGPLCVWSRAKRPGGKRQLTRQFEPPSIVYVRFHNGSPRVTSRGRENQKRRPPPYPRLHPGPSRTGGQDKAHQAALRALCWRLLHAVLLRKTGSLRDSSAFALLVSLGKMQRKRGRISKTLPRFRDSR